jgi:RHS repeat-associated protein
MRFIRAGWFANASSPLQPFATAAALWLLGSALAHAQAPVATTTYGYDETANKTSQVDARSRTTTWEFDAKSRVVGRTLQDGSKEVFRYDSEDNLLARTTFAGEVFTFQYDMMNRRTGEIIPAGVGANTGVAGGSVVYGYTSVGKLQSRKEQGSTTLNGVQTFKYNAVDRLLEARSPIGQISYQPDPMGRVLERSISGAGTVRYEYDAEGRLMKVIAADGKQTRYAYDGGGRLRAIERDLNTNAGQAQFLRTSIEYDAAGRITLIADVKHIGAGATFMSGQRLTRIGNGAIVKIETNRADGSISTTGQPTARLDVVQAFEYDAVARLTRETRTHSGGTSDTRYEYDTVGNRSKMTVTASAGTEITTYSYDIADRLTQETVSLPSGGTRIVNYTYDGNGNLASKNEAGKVTLYRFDPRNRLIDVRIGGTLAEAQASSPRMQYAYDSDGNRVRKVGIETRAYLIDTSYAYPHLARETTSSETVDYVRGLGLIRQTRVTSSGVEELYPLYGHLGTSLGAVNAHGDVVEQLDVDAFGNLDQPAGLRQSHTFTGEYWDEDAQLLYLRARWYDPKIGRFVSADPFEGKQHDPRSLNRYAYAHADPVANIDPTGRTISMSEIGMGLAIVGSLAMIAQNSMPKDPGAPGSQDNSGGTGSMDPCKAFGIGCKDDGLGTPGPGRAQTRINIQTGNNKEGWTHVVNRHFNPSKNASQFTISEQEVRSLLGSGRVVQTPANKMLTSSGTGEPASIRYVRVVDVGREIGIDKFSGPTQTMTVMTDGYGNLITCFPGML